MFVGTNLDLGVSSLRRGHAALLSVYSSVLVGSSPKGVAVKGHFLFEHFIGTRADVLE